MAVSSESSTPQKCESCPVLFWQIGFVIALALAGAFVLICCCLLGGRYYKEEAKKNAENFTQVLKHQAKLWKQERERWEKERELRLEEQRHKNAAWEQNSELRDDIDDVMEENRVLRDQKDKLNHRNEQLELENERLGMENAGLAVRMAQAERPGQEAETISEPELEPERPRSKVHFSSTLFNSGLPPGSNLSLEKALEKDLDSPQSQASFPSRWSGSDPDTPTRTELPPSPPDNGQNPRTSNLMGGMVTMGGLLSGRKQRNTWDGHSESPSPPPEDDKWKPVSPDQHRASVG